MARTGLAAELDQALAEHVSPVMEGAGFRAIKRPRVWERADEQVTQWVGFQVDGRYARDGYLTVRPRVGLTFAGETGRDAGPAFAGRELAHEFTNLDPAVNLGEEWRFESGWSAGLGVRASAYLVTKALPTLERWRRPRAVRDHYVADGQLLPAIRMSLAIGDRDVARLLAPAFVDATVRDLTVNNPSPWSSASGQALEVVADTGAEIAAADRTALLDHLAECARLWRTAPQFPDWLADYERRFLQTPP